MDRSDGKDSCFGGTRVTFAVSFVIRHILYGGLELLIPVSTSRVLGFQLCAMSPGLGHDEENPGLHIVLDKHFID